MTKKETKINQHHCPKCRFIAKPRCYTKGHLVLCEKHGNYYNPYFSCVRCKGEERRGSDDSQGTETEEKPATN